MSATILKRRAHDEALTKRNRQQLAGSTLRVHGDTPGLWRVIDADGLPLTPTLASRHSAELFIMGYETARLELRDSHAQTDLAQTDLANADLVTR